MLQLETSEHHPMPEPTKLRAVALVGILNITEDSFSDGGLFLKPERAVDQARQLMDSGARLVELGPASSHPDAQKVTAELEIARLESVVGALVEAKIPFAVDSFETATQRWSLARGAAMLNDIQGFSDESIWDELAAHNCDLVVMHSIQQRGPATRAPAREGRILDRVLAFFATRLAELERAGIARKRMVVDPGMGFFLGASPAPSLEMLRELSRLRREVECRVLVSVSRKSFLGAVCADPETGSERPIAERLPATLAAELFAARQGVDFLRTHDVKSLSDALRISLSLEGESFFAAASSL
jgi:dihydropteroate synthase type 2